MHGRGWGGGGGGVGALLSFDFVATAVIVFLSWGEVG